MTSVFQGALPNEAPHSLPEVLREILLEFFFEEGLVKDDRTFVVTLLLILPDHEFMPVGAVANRRLIHDIEGFTILKGLFDTLLSVDTDQLHNTGWRSSEVVLCDNFVAFEDAFDSFGRIE